MTERTLKQNGIRFGRLWGIDLWIHWTLVLWFGYVLYLEWIQEGGWGTVLRTCAWWAAVFGTILIHELGHCYAAARQGGGADAVVLWPLGGLAYCDAPHLPWNQFWVAAGGPAVQILLIALVAIPIWLLGLEVSAFPGPGDSYLEVILGALFWWSMVTVAFNLVPLYPLDGGRMFQAVLWGKLKSHGRASLITVWVSQGVIILALVAGLFTPEWVFRWPVVLILCWAYFETDRLRRRLASGEAGEDYVFGYDFSRGYTSLERTATRDRPRARASFLGRLRTRARESRELREAEVRRRVDGLLEKIARDGMMSLSRSERRFLERASKKFHRP